MGYTEENGIREEARLVEVKRFALTSADTTENALDLVLGYAWGRIALGDSHEEAYQDMRDRYYLTMAKGEKH